jgi:hypothetical protein
MSQLYSTSSSALNIGRFPGLIRVYFARPCSGDLRVAVLDCAADKFVQTESFKP